MTAGISPEASESISALICGLLSARVCARVCLFSSFVVQKNQWLDDLYRTNFGEMTEQNGGTMRSRSDSYLLQLIKAARVTSLCASL